jgi:diadenosine tetraphosphate (Ap4A) HIT family hydrolase
MFALDGAFERTSAPLAELGFCHARLQLDARFPWIVLIPRIDGVGAIEDVDPHDHSRLMAEVMRAGEAARAIGEATGRPVARLNIGVLGNITPQLHIHVVGRRPDDAAWPGPVWGHGAPEPYAAAALAAALAAARGALGA